MIADGLRILELSALASSTAILFVLLLRKPMRARLGAQAAYVLWLLVPVAAAVVLLPAPVASKALAVLPAVVGQMTMSPVVGASSEVQFDPAPWLVGAWLLGLGSCALLLFWQQRRFVRALGRLSMVGDRIVRAEATAGCPALVGAWHPHVVLPADFERRYSAAERELILAHERAHCARGDAQLNVFAALLRCLFWFNPLVYIAVSRFRFDQELACDAAVIARFPEARRPYADAMLKTQLADIGLPAGCYWQSSHPLKERISMLKHPLPGRARRVLGITLAATFVLGGTYAAWAAQPVVPAQLESLDSIRGTVTYAIDDGGTHTVDIAALAGKPFLVADSNTPDHWELHGTFITRADRMLQFDGVLTRAGEVMSSPRLIMHEGEPAQIKVGVEQDGKFKGFAAEITLAHDGSALVLGAGEPGDTRLRATYRKLKRIDYPMAALEAGIEGTVYVKAHVSADGDVSNAQVDDGRARPAKVLADAAIAGVKAWTFNPATKDGQAVANDEIVPIVFALNRKLSPRVEGATLDAIVVSPPQAFPAADAAPTENVDFRKSATFAPKYPVAAVVAHQTGKIVLRVSVDEQGNPQSAVVDTAEPPEAQAIFGDTAIASVMQWRFNPGVRDGKLVGGDVLVPFTFSLRDED